MKLQINVNELVDLIKKEYKLEDAVIREAEIANINNQWDPEKKRISYGGVLTLHVEGKRIKKKLKCKVFKRCKRPFDYGEIGTPHIGDVKRTKKKRNNKRGG